MKLTENSIVCKSDNLLEADINDSLALMSVDEGFYYGLNPMAKEIWGIIDEPIAVQKLIHELLNRFSVKEDICKEDTMLFLNELFSRKILKVK